MNDRNPELHRARERIRRSLYMSTGLGAVIFGGLLAGKISSQWSELWAPFAISALIVCVAIPATLTGLAWIVPTRVLDTMAGATVVAFVILQILWVPSMVAPHLADGAAPWMQGVNAVQATLAAVVWRHKLVWLYAVAQGPIVATVRYLATGSDVRAALLDGLGAIVFCTILMAVAIALINAAQQQDLVAARARAQASLEAGSRTREREQARINAIVHDDIMSVLLYAAREDPGPRLAEQAESALASIATLSIDPGEAPDYHPTEVVTALRSGVSAGGEAVDFWSSVTSEKPIPANVVEALTEATSEAVRNSIVHAGDDPAISRLVRVTVTEGGIRATIQDSGKGFSVRGVHDRRLGIRVSIFERMRLLAGGNARVDSRPGQGTTVTLTWSRQE
jgi:Histidine kinase-, DNA gyrase B-, and HSP90-like ATPase